LLVDLRSDTVTRPSAAMRRAIAEAEVGDAVLGDDPTVNELERFAAELLGKERALFFPSGIMANTTALMLHAAPGTEAVIDAAGISSTTRRARRPPSAACSCERWRPRAAC
jgi:threonine aldolase